MTYFMAFDRGTGQPKWAGECDPDQLPGHATAAIGIVPLARKGLVYDEAANAMQLDLSAAVEALLAHVGSNVLAHAAVVEAVPNLALMVAAAETAGPLFPVTGE